MKTVFVVPWRSDGGGRRAELWKYTRAWMENHHDDYPIITSDGDAGPFNRGQAINRGAAEAGDWDVMIVCDADNIADPYLVNEAVKIAVKTGRVVMPFEVYTYLDKYSSDRLMNGDSFMFLSPVTMGPVCCGARDHYYTHTVLHHHHSGVQVFPREAWEAVGGFVEFKGWGYEDSVMADLLQVFGGGIKWLQGSALHLWHEHAYDPRLSDLNNQEWRRISRNRNPRRLRQVLADRGHIIP